MLINNWYVPAQSADLSDAPLPVRMLGQDFVLFRDEQGTAHCLADTCVHRGGSLCRGSNVDGTIQCPYHGWRFDGSGRCVEIPYVDPEKRIPARARVDSYPVHEQWGWIWVFVGDLPEDERPVMPAADLFPEWYAAEQGDDSYRMVRGAFTFEANWVRAIENVLDPAHGFFVHSNFGNPDQRRVWPFEVEQDERQILARHRFMPITQKETWRSGLAEETDDADNQLLIYWPGLVFRNDIRPRPGIHHMVMSAYLPIDEFRTLNIWIHARNFYAEAEHDADAVRRVNQVFEEDAAVINHVKPVQPPGLRTSELLLEADKHITAFRQRVREHEALGFRIDSAQLAAELNQARAIPCPARRDNPKNWVLPPVPLVPGEAVDRPARAGAA